MSIAFRATVSTVPIRSHYVVDVIAGIAVALSSLRLANVYLSATDRLPPLETWDRTPEGRRILATLKGWRVIGTVLRRPFNASRREDVAAT
jgi:hypothetical protein